MQEELAYSIHLGSDKNKTNKAKEVAKNNPSGTTSFSNNGIQNAQQLSKVNKHNLRDYENNNEDIFILKGTDNLYQDVKQIYLQEFEESRIEYNNKQTREDRKINDYFKHISDSSLWDLACEIVIELGDMEYWQDKDKNYRMKMVDVYNEQVKDLEKIVPEFRIANAVIHFDETSPHLHIVGVPVTDNNKRGMKKQVAKSKIFTKDSLKNLQDKMRICCIKSYNKFYEKNDKLKHKQKGRNIDVNVKDMKNYKEFKNQYSQNRKKFERTTENIDNIDNSSKNIDFLLDNLKPTRLNKTNKIITDDEIKQIKEYMKDVSKTTKSVRNINGLNKFIDDFEDKYSEMQSDNRSLEYQVELRDNEIYRLKKENSSKDKQIKNLKYNLEIIKGQLYRFKNFWKSIMSHFHNRICYDNDENYKIVSDDLYKNGIFTDDENEIANNISRKVKLKDDESTKNNRYYKNNDDTR